MVRQTQESWRPPKLSHIHDRVVLAISSPAPTIIISTPMTSLFRLRHGQAWLSHRRCRPLRVNFPAMLVFDKEDWIRGWGVIQPTPGNISYRWHDSLREPQWIYGLDFEVDYNILSPTWAYVVKFGLKTYAGDLCQEAITNTKKITEDYQADILDPVVLQMLNERGACNRSLDCICSSFSRFLFEHEYHFFWVVVVVTVFDWERERLRRFLSGFPMIDFHPDTWTAVSM